MVQNEIKMRKPKKQRLYTCVYVRGLAFVCFAAACGALVCTVGV